LEGLGEGTTFPAINALLARWVPIKERSKAGAIGNRPIVQIIGLFLSISNPIL
jgi:ACS family sodium-dependent inorganic phosphate cotransporter